MAAVKALEVNWRSSQTGIYTVDNLRDSHKYELVPLGKKGICLALYVHGLRRRGS